MPTVILTVPVIVLVRQQPMIAENVLVVVVVMMPTAIKIVMRIVLVML